MGKEGGGRNNPPLEFNFGSRYRSLKDYNPDQFKKRKIVETNDSFFDRPTISSGQTNNTLGRWLIMERTDNGDLLKTSSFLIGKTIMGTAGGELKYVHKLGNGTILMETANKKQAEKLMKLNCLLDIEKTPIKISEHPTLNTCKGIAFCDDFEFLPEDEILEGLQSQGVVHVRKLMRTIHDVKQPTRGAVLTFNKPKVPEYIIIGYYRTEVQLYIPNPLRCKNCHKYNHHESKCRSLNENPPITKCGNCGDNNNTDGHIRNETKNTVNCTNSSKCINCNKSHPVWDKKCEIFQKEFHIQKIKTINKITIREARKYYHEKYGNTNASTEDQSYAQITTHSNKEKPQPKEKPTTFNQANKINQNENQSEAEFEDVSPKLIFAAAEDDQHIVDLSSPPASNHHMPPLKYFGPTEEMM